MTPVQDSVTDTIQHLKRYTHEVPVTSDETGSRNAGPASHLFSDGSCVRRTRIQWTSALDASFVARHQLVMWSPWLKRKDGEMVGQMVRGSPGNAINKWAPQPTIIKGPS